MKTPKSVKSPKSKDPKSPANPGDICGVCRKVITESDPFCYTDPNDPDIKYRHRACGPGSKAWSAKHGTSEIGELLSHKKPKKAPRLSAAKDPVHQAIKEFCGREKYMRYMDTVNKFDIDWTIEVTVNGHHITQTKADAPLDVSMLYKQVNEESR